MIFLTKDYFDILDNMYSGLSYFETILQIKHCITRIILSCPSFFSRSCMP